MIIELKQRAKILVVTVAFSSGCLAVFPGVAEAQYTDMTSIETSQNTTMNVDSDTNEELQPAPEPSERLMVYPGDTLWSISQRHLGPQASPQQIANEAERIFELNRDRIGEDPSMLMPGEELFLTPSALQQADRPENTSEASVSTASASAEPAAEQAAITASAPVEPGVGAFSETAKSSWLNERKLIGLGIIILALALTILILWKMPMRRQVGREVWGAFALVNHQTPRKPSANEMLGGQLVTPSQIRKGSSKAAHKPLVNRQVAGNLYLSGNVHARRKLLNYPQTPLSRTNRERNGWPTGVHTPQVRRALKRMADTRAY